MASPTPEESPPPILYKYYPPERLDIFENWSIRFTNPEAFNDTFDSDFVAKGVPGIVRRFKFRISLGIFCLCEDPDEQLMWVHYAKQHTGFVLGFATDDKVFAEAKGVFHRVIYSLPPAYILDGDPPIELCRYKTPNWEYEREWRCIRVTKPGTSRDVGMEPTAIKEIILGSHMEKHHISSVLRMIEVLKTECVMPKVFESQPNMIRRSFTHVPTTFRHCVHCGGFGHIT